MTKFELENLKDLPVPPARDAAKRAAIAAAAEAYDAAKKDSDDQTKGAEETARPTHHSQQPKVRPMRSLKIKYAMAASVAALMIAAPTAFYIIQQPLRQPEFQTVDTGLQGGKPSTIASVPPASPAKNEFNVANSPEPALPNAMTDKDAISADAKTDGRIAPPLEVRREDFAARGADPAKPALSQSPTDGLGAVGNPGNTMGLNIGGGWPKVDEAAPSASVAAAPQPIDRPAQVGDALFKEEYKAKRMRNALSMAPAAEKPSYNAYGGMGHDDEQKAQVEQEHRDKFESVAANPVKQVQAEPVSTFSIDVDTASYAFVRRALNGGHLPPKDAVRVEEMINYFPYTYPAPETVETPFQPTVTVTPAPWNAANQLVHVAIKGYDLKTAERPRANLVLLMDISGSMQPEDRLPLVKNAFRMLVDQLKPDDTVGIVTYASGSGVALEPTKISDKSKILAAIDKLGAGGSTAGAEGIQDAYRLAESNFDKGAVNRVILATDGDFNVGITDQNELKGYIERKRQTGIFLSILGVGEGNLNDSLMQTLAQNGNGTAAHVDTLNEARKVLVDEASSTLFTIAKDVKIQFEFNPARVAEYRLIGYETRNLRREDFNNDKVDAGEIGSGHTVTAIYEVTPIGAPRLVEDLRYGTKTKEAAAAQPAVSGDVKDQEFGFLKLRYKLPKEDASKLVTLAIKPDLEKKSVAEASPDVRFSIAVAAFGQLLKGQPYLQSFGYDDVIALAQTAKGDDPFGYRAEFVNLVRLAKSAQP